MTALERAARTAHTAPDRLSRIRGAELVACSRLRGMMAARGTNHARVGRYAVMILGRPDDPTAELTVSRIADGPAPDQVAAWPDLDR